MCRYDKIIKHARQNCLKDFEGEKNWYLNACNNIDDAIKLACESKFPRMLNGISDSNDMLMCGHQCRVGASKLHDAFELLKKHTAKITKVKDFDALHNIISSINKIDGVGPLAVYDIAERISWYLEKHPKSVYLHAGVTDGAKAMKLDVKRKYIPIFEFPASFQCLEPMEIETILCCYKNELANAISFNVLK